MAGSADKAESLLASATAFLKTLLAVGRNRLELLLVEAQEERARFFWTLLLAAGVAVLGLMALLLLTFTIVVLFWDGHRLAVLAGFTLLYAAGAAGAFWKLRQRLRNWTAFSATLAELEKDKACWADRP